MNIAAAIGGMPAEKVRPWRLASVRVWETPKTFAEYRGA